MTEREVLARIIDREAWAKRDSYLAVMAPGRDTPGGATSEAIDGVAARKVKYSLAKADAILSRPVAEGWEARARELEGALRRLADVADNLIGELQDPGTEALAAVWCARQLLFGTDCPSLLSGGSCSGEGSAVSSSLAPVSPEGVESYQDRVGAWMLACFGTDITNDRTERAYRFLEESVELVQSLDVTREEAHRLVDYTFDRPKGETAQEVGGVAVTLATLCTMAGVNLKDAAEAELARVWTKVDQIRAKHASKPKDVRSPLPGSLAPVAESVREPAEEADSYMRALLEYSSSFYGAAREAGLSAVFTADAMAHIERAARNLHRLALSALSRPTGGA